MCLYGVCDFTNRSSVCLPESFVWQSEVHIGGNMKQLKEKNH